MRIDFVCRFRKWCIHFPWHRSGDKLQQLNSSCMCFSLKIKDYFSFHSVSRVVLFTLSSWNPSSGFPTTFRAFVNQFWFRSQILILLHFLVKLPMSHRASMIICDAPKELRNKNPNISLRILPCIWEAHGKYAFRNWRCMIQKWEFHDLFEVT